MEGTIRAFNETHRDDLHECVHKVSELIAESGGAKAQVNIQRGYPVTSNDAGLTEWSVPVLQRVAGAGSVGICPKTCGAEDFSYYQRVVPGFFFFIGCTPKDEDCKKAASNHSPRFYVDETGLKLGVKALATLALAWLGANAAERNSTSRRSAAGGRLLRIRFRRCDDHMVIDGVFPMHIGLCIFGRDHHVEKSTARRIAHQHHVVPAPCRSVTECGALGFARPQHRAATRLDQRHGRLAVAQIRIPSAAVAIGGALLESNQIHHYHRAVIGKTAHERFI